MKGKWFPQPGDEVTFNCELISIGGQILHTKGEKATVSKTTIREGHWYRPLPDIWVPDELMDVSIVEDRGVCFLPDTFEEFEQANTTT